MFLQNLRSWSDMLQNSDADDISISWFWTELNRGWPGWSAMYTRRALCLQVTHKEFFCYVAMKTIKRFEPTFNKLKSNTPR